MVGYKLRIIIMIFFLSVTAHGAQKPRQSLIPDGFILNAVDGTISSNDGNDVWIFTLSSDLNDVNIKISAGTNLRILPCLVLEQMTSDFKQHPDASYRLSARVIEYKGSNFIFPLHFLPLTKANPLQNSEKKSGPGIGEPNDEFTIPEEIVKKLRTGQGISRRPAELQQARVSAAVKQNVILANRTGIICPYGTRKVDGEKKEAQYVFILDALGRNINENTYLLLPCRALEQAEQQFAGGGLQSGPIRFDVAGIVTEYKGNKFLLLHRATRAYSNGNFGR